MKNFTVNNKVYPVVEFDFNMVCDLEDRGLSVDNIDQKPMKILREYLSIVGNMSSRQAGKEIEAHVISGHDLTDAYNALNEAMESSGFFRAMSEQTSKEDQAEEVGESEKTKEPEK